MTFGELIDQTTEELDELVATPKFHTRDIVKDALNNGLRCLAEATEFYESVSPITIDSVAGALAIDTEDIDGNGTLCITRVQNAATNQWMRFKTVEYMDQTYRQWTNTRGQPEIIVPRSFNTVHVFPQPDKSSGEFWRVFTSSLPPDMLAEGEDPPLDLHFQRALVEYALYELLLQEKEVAQAMEHWAEYSSREAALTERLAHKRARVSVLGAGL